MPKSPSDNKIQPENVTVEESGPVDWDNIAIAVPYDVKSEIILAARQERLTVSEWGRKVLMDALEQRDGERRSGVDRRRSA